MGVIHSVLAAIAIGKIAFAIIGGNVANEGEGGLCLEQEGEKEEEERG